MESKQVATGYTVEGQVNLMMSWPLEWFTDREKLTAAGRHFYSIGLAESQARVEVLQKAVEATSEYFEACARQWAANDGRVVSEAGTIIEGSEEVERLCNRAGSLVVAALNSVSEGEKGGS